MNKKVILAALVGLTCLAGQPSFAASAIPTDSVGAAIADLVVGAAAGSSARSQAWLKDYAKQVSQKSKVTKKLKKAKKPKKTPTRDVPEINAASGVQALALLIGVLLLGAERLRRYS